MSCDVMCNTLINGSHAYSKILKTVAGILHLSVYSVMIVLL